MIHRQKRLHPSAFGTGRAAGTSVPVERLLGTLALGVVQPLQHRRVPTNRANHAWGTTPGRRSPA